MEEVEKRKRGRPKGSKNKKNEVLPPVKNAGTDETAPKGKYKFITGKCNCVYYKDIIGAGMFCEHRFSMFLDTDKRK